MNDDKIESISAKLRRWADESENKQRSIYPTLNAGEDFGINLNQKDFIIECELFRRIADDVDREIAGAREVYLCEKFARFAEVIGKPMLEDETIEGWLDRYYLPRPIFEDGEPVEVGDFVELNGYTREVTGLHVSCDGKVTMNMKDGSSTTFDGEIPLFKRSKQPVLDADGVPIEVGDTVWTINVPKGHDKLTVKGFRTFEKMGTTDVPSTHAVLFEEIGWIGNLRVTHREPDNQERIDEDATMPPREYYAKHIGHDVGLKDDEEVWTAVMAHLLRRQRELDGRDA